MGRSWGSHFDLDPSLQTESILVTEASLDLAFVQPALLVSAVWRDQSWRGEALATKPTKTSIRRWFGEAVWGRGQSMGAPLLGFALGTLLGGAGEGRRARVRGAILPGCCYCALRIQGEFTAHSFSSGCFLWFAEALVVAPPLESPWMGLVPPLQLLTPGPQQLPSDSPHCLSLPRFSMLDKLPPWQDCLCHRSLPFLPRPQQLSLGFMPLWLPQEGRTETSQVQPLATTRCSSLLKHESGL